MIADLVYKQAEQAALERLQRLAKSLQAYDGRLEPCLKSTPSDPYAKDNIRFTWPRMAVDKGASFLFGPGVKFHVTTPGTDGENQPDEALEALLEQFWQFNQKDILLHEIAVNGGIFGDAFVKIVPSAKPGEMPRLVNLSPEWVYPFTKVDDYTDVYAYRIQWHGVEVRNGEQVVVYRRQRIERDENGLAWMIYDEEQVQRAAIGYAPQPFVDKWSLLQDPVKHPFGWCPIVHIQNLPSPNEFWGRADLEDDQVGIAQSANFVASNIKRIIRHHAHPQPYGVGLNPKTELESAPGKLWQLPQGTSLGLLEMGGDLASSMSMLDRLREEFWLSCRIPGVSIGRVDDKGPQSGVALRVQYQPLLELTATKEKLYGAALNTINRNVLELMGQSAEGRDITCGWPERLPRDKFAEAQAAVELQAAGVSKKTTLEDMGYDWSAESEQKKSEYEEAMQMQADTFNKGFGAKPYGGGGMNA